MRWLYCILYSIIWPFFNLYHATLRRGKQNIPEGGCLICANHSAYSDPIFVIYAMGLGYQVHPMAKAELLKIPVIGPLLKAAGIFGVERGKSDIGAIKTALSLLKNGKYVLMFPEGTRVKDEADSAAKTGAAMIAIRTGVPVLPVWVPRRKGFLRPVRVVFGEPYKMECEGKPNSETYARCADELLEKIYALGEAK